MKVMWMILAALWSTPAFAWAHHFMVTDNALQHEGLRYTEELSGGVPAETLEALLEAEQTAIAQAIADHYAWLTEQGSDQFIAATLTAPTREAFLAATRLHPDTRFPMVIRLLPNEQLDGMKVPHASVSPYFEAEEPVRGDFVAVTPGEKVAPSTVMASHTDEPDWGMDRSLWSIDAYGYGDQPYGNPEGTSSQAPFHMQFQHEHVIVQKFAGKFLKGMVPDRVDLFIRLSKAAFETGHPYWGLRFAAWATHYAQDLCQPYHAKTVPSAGTGYYLRYIVTPNKDRFESKSTQVLSNRHFLYEDYVAVQLHQSYQSQGDDLLALRTSLSADPLRFEGVTNAEELMAAVTGPAVDHGPATEKAIIRSFGKKLTRDPTYSVEDDPDFTIGAVIAERGDLLEPLVRATVADFEQTGLATRTVLHLVGAIED